MKIEDVMVWILNFIFTIRKTRHNNIWRQIVFWYGLVSSIDSNVVKGLKTNRYNNTLKYQNMLVTYTWKLIRYSRMNDSIIRWRLQIFVVFKVFAFIFRKIARTINHTYARHNSYKREKTFINLWFKYNFYFTEFRLFCKNISEVLTPRLIIFIIGTSCLIYF